MSKTPVNNKSKLGKSMNEGNNTSMNSTMSAFKNFDRSQTSEMFNHSHIQGFQGIKSKYQQKGKRNKDESFSTSFYRS